MRSLPRVIVLYSLSAQAFAGNGPPVAAVPTLSEWGMISLGLAIVGAGLYLLRDNKK